MTFNFQVPAAGSLHKMAYTSGAVEEKANCVRARNRRAQQAFRSRQKVHHVAMQTDP